MVEGYQVIILFRVLNFGIIAGLFGYLFSVYLMPKLREKINEQKAMRDQRYQQYQQNNHRFDVIQALCAKEGMQYTHAKQRIIDWQERVHAQQVEQQERKEGYRQRIIQRQAIVQRYRDEQYVYKQIGPTIINDLEQELRSSFNDQAGSAYVANIIHSLNKAGDR